MRPTTVFACLVALTAAATAAHGKPDAAQILRKAEAVRNPNLDYAVDFTIHGVSHGTPRSERDASYSMVAHGKDRSVILMRSPDALFGALVLMVDGRYWMLLPSASRPWELSSAQMRNGDVATGDLVRANLTRGYRAALSGEDTIEAEDCFRLELEADDGAAYYARILYWVSKSGFLPRKIEYYGASGALLKTVAYRDYRPGALGLRSMRLVIDSLDEWKESSTLSFANLRKIDRGRLSLAPDGMVPFRDAALAARRSAGSAEVALERILGAVAPARGPQKDR